MELAELTAYAKQRYQIEALQKWAELPGLSVLCHPQTGSWVALLMRQWDTETGNRIERCDLKCGVETLARYRRSWLSSPIRMHGSRWISVAFDARTERELVVQLFDQAIRAGMPLGCTIVIDHGETRPETGSQESPLPFAGSEYRPRQEQIPERLRKLRRLYSASRDRAQDREKLFYEQAVFMRDYEDDYPWTGCFECYFPSYQDMTLLQLRGYFSWRTQVRKGNFQPIEASAAYIYLYELLNGVGASSPEEALQKLRAFLAGYLDRGLGDQRMRQNLYRWMLEYAVLNGLPQTLAREAADPELIATDAALAVLRQPAQQSDETVFAALCRFGDPKFLESPVFTAAPERAAQLIAAAWRTASAECREAQTPFVRCFGQQTRRRWYPLANAIRYLPSRPQDTVYVLDECRTYRCEQGVWLTEAYEKLSFDRDAFRGFLHAADERLRRYLKTRPYLRARPAEEWAIPYIDAVIAADAQAQREAARPKITIDLSGLARIRADAAVTRDSLLTEDEIDEKEEPAAAPAYTVAPDAAELPLDTVQLRILRALLDGGDVSALLKAERLMPSIAADFLNEALLDELGDSVVRCENDRIFLVEDYIEDLKRLLGGDQNG